MQICCSGPATWWVAAPQSAKISTDSKRHILKGLRRRLLNYWEGALSTFINTCVLSVAGAMTASGTATFLRPCFFFSRRDDTTLFELSAGVLCLIVYCLRLGVSVIANAYLPRALEGSGSLSHSGGLAEE